MLLAIDGDTVPVNNAFRDILRILTVLFLFLIQGDLHSLELKGLVEITQNHRLIAQEETDTSKSLPWPGSPWNTHSIIRATRALKEAGLSFPCEWGAGYPCFPDKCRETPQEDAGPDLCPGGWWLPQQDLPASQQA